MWLDHNLTFAGSPRAGEIADGPEQKKKTCSATSGHSRHCRGSSISLCLMVSYCVCALHLRRSTLFLKWCSDGCLCVKIFKHLQDCLDRVKRQRELLHLWFLCPVAQFDDSSTLQGPEMLRHFLAYLDALFLHFRSRLRSCSSLCPSWTLVW